MASPQEARVPDIGGYDDVPVIEVLVAAGDVVAKDQGLVTLESDKATMEVPAPFAGTVREVRVKVGDTLSEGGLVALIEPAEDAGGEDGAAQGAKAAQDDAPAPRAQPEAPSQARPAAETGEQVAPVAVPEAADNIARASIEKDAATTGARPAPTRAFDGDALLPGKVPHASPAVRLFARELGVDLSQVQGTARGGRISREDVQKFVKSALAGGGAPAAAGGGLSLLPWPKVDFAKFGEVEAQPLSRIRRISGANLARNWAMIPHVTQHDDADITDLEALRVALNREHEKAGIKLTMLALIMKASVAALRRFPGFNASLDPSV